MSLYAATSVDSERLWQLRSEPRAQFWSRSNNLTREQHEAWFHQALSSPDHFILLGPEGYGRLQTNRETFVSFAVAPEFRDQGYGKTILKMLEGRARATKCPRLYALVHPGNWPSMSAFAAEGYKLKGTRDEYSLLEKELR